MIDSITIQATTLEVNNAPRPLVDVVAGALRLAGLKIPVFPLRPPLKEHEGDWGAGKVPWEFPSKEPGGKPRHFAFSKGATTDPKVIARWTRKYPGCNLGVRFGGWSRLLGIDIDGPEGEASFADICDGREIPDLLEVRSGRAEGGRHLWFRCHQDLPFKIMNGAFPSVDIRWTNGFLVGPPSVHATTGLTYQFNRDPEDGIPRCPQFLIDVIIDAWAKRRARKSATLPARAERDDQPKREQPERILPELPVTTRSAVDMEPLIAYAITRWPIPGPGERHDLLREMCMVLAWEGYDLGTIVAVGRRWHAHFYGEGLCRTAAAENDADLNACARSAVDKVGGWIRPSPVVVGDDLTHFAQAIDFDKKSRERAAEKSNTRGAAPGVSQNRDFGQPKTRCLDDQKLPNIHPKAVRTRQHKQFVAVLLHVYRRERRLKPSGPYQWTRAQVANEAHRLFGVTWSMSQIQKLYDRFIGRPAFGKIPPMPAERLELAVMTDRGQPGSDSRPASPSSFKITGLHEFLSPSETTACPFSTN